MFKQLFGGVQEAVERLQGGGTDSTRDVRSTDVAAGRAAAKKESGVISDIDKRAQSGDVSFEDFLKIGRTFKQFKGKVPGMPGTLTDDQVAETLKKFEIPKKTHQNQRKFRRKWKKKENLRKRFTNFC